MKLAAHGPHVTCCTHFGDHGIFSKRNVISAQRLNFILVNRTVQQFGNRTMRLNNIVKLFMKLEKDCCSLPRAVNDVKPNTKQATKKKIRS